MSSLVSPCWLGYSSYPCLAKTHQDLAYDISSMSSLKFCWCYNLNRKKIRTTIFNLSEFCPSFVRVLSWFCPGFVRVLSGFCPGFVQVLSGFCPGFVRVLSGFCMGFVRVLSWFCPGFVLVLSRFCPGFVRVCLRTFFSQQISTSTTTR